MDFNNFKYFIEQYVEGANGGGTFTFDELIDLFIQIEKQDDINNLKDDVNRLKDILYCEDWEIEKDTLDYVLKHGGKKHTKKIVNLISTKLASTV